MASRAGHNATNAGVGFWKIMWPNLNLRGGQLTKLGAIEPYVLILSLNRR